MNKLLPLALFLLVATTGMAQNKSLITGRVIDSLNSDPVELATVAVLEMRDTSSVLLSYTLTDKKGAFVLHNVPDDVPLKLLISFVAYQPYRKFFTLKKGETLNMAGIRMSPRQLTEITVKGERMPIVVRKDTIEFLAEAFKVRPNEVVEDLLKKLPGVEVANDGNITVMGKKVTKILVDDREFFPSDPRIASKNLDADLIDKVQIYDDREDDPDHLIPQSKVKKIINLKFKRALKKSIFGKIYGGQGTQDHYQLGGLFNMFRDTLQISLLGLRNNLNNTGLDFNDLYTNGGLNRGGDALYKGGFGGLGFGGPTGKQTATTGGVNINTDYGKKLKINISYLYKNTHTTLSSLTRQQQLLNDTLATTESQNNQLVTNINQYINGTVTWRPNTATQVKYSPGISITQNNSSRNNTSNSFSNFINPINNASDMNDLRGNTFQFQHSFNYNHQLKKKGSSINIDQSVQFNPSTSHNFEEQDLVYYTSSFPSSSFKQREDDNNKSTDINGALSYRYPVTSKLTVDASISEEYINQLNKVSTYDYNPATGQYDSFLLIKSSDLTRDMWIHTFSPGFTYNFPKNMSLVAHLYGRWQQVNNIFKRDVNNIERQYINLMPNISLTIKSFSLSYNRSLQTPNIGDMIPYSVVFSPIYSVKGNPDLKPTSQDIFNIGFSKSDYKSGSSYSLNASATFEQNSILRKRTLDENLVETSMPINRDGRNNFRVGGYLSKRIKTKALQFNSSTNLNLYRSHDFYVLNRQDGTQNTYTANLSQRFSMNWKDIIELDPQYTLSKVYTTYSGINTNSRNYMTHNIDNRFNIFWPKHMDLEGNYTFNYSPLVPAGFQKSSNLLTLSLARQFLKKDRGEIKLSCYDILNQNVSMSRFINANSITDTQSQIIKRYFLLTLQFKFNKTKLK